MKALEIAGEALSSRLLMGTGKFPNNQAMYEAIKTGRPSMVTVALKRVDMKDAQDQMLQKIKDSGAKLLPNTSGVRNAKEAVFAAELAREALETNWLKLEIHPDPRYLLPDPIETLKATEILAKKGFNILHLKVI